jgi:allantoinase
MPPSPAGARPDTDGPADLVLRGRRVVAGGRMEPAAVHVRDRVITAVTAWDDVPPEAQLVDVGDAVLMPGLVDTHVHINEPGRTEWEGFETATRAAAAGGVTTLVDMPLNSVPATTSVVALAAKLAAARGRLHVDVGFWGGVVPGNEEQLEPLWDAGVLGFKCFLSPSGVDEFGNVGEAELRTALPALARLGAPLLAHAELPEPLARAALAVAELDPRRYAVYLASRPRQAEQQAIELLVRLCRATGAHVHVVHLADADALPLLRAARAEGLPITVETCPHYLHFAAEEIADGATDHKCAPPVREAENRERLWDALGAGDIDLIVTDHSPCPPEMKGLDTGDFLRAWGGIASLQLTLPVAWKGARERGYTPVQLAEWMCAAPARLAGLDGRKGSIAPGHDADFVVWHPEAELTVDPARLHHRHSVTPYAGATLPGVVQATYLRGRRIYDHGRLLAEPTGRTLSRHTR